jgi:hypothetical protein
MWSLIVGFALPPVLSIVQQSDWSDRLRAVVAFVACAVAAAGTAYFQGDLTGERFVEAGLVILVTEIATYKGFWKPTGVSPAIETKTNV